MSRRPYCILQVSEFAVPRRVRSHETMGTKEKFWFEHIRTNQRVMVKIGREGVGEDWSEKLAYEIGRLWGVPCARVDLAEVGRRRAVVCWGFLTRGRDLSPGAKRDGDPSLIHGNEMLLRRDRDYPSKQTYGVPQHTLESVSDVLKDCEPAVVGPLGPTALDAFDTFVGYLMLDALIGNTDRHHENWGVISQRTPDGHRLRLAPSYDHASSLGRELSDIKRRGRLDSSGRGTVAEYAERGKSALYSSEGAKMSPFEALLAAARMRPHSFSSWQRSLQGVTFDALKSETERVPESRLSPIGKRFTQELLRHNYCRILQAKP